MGFVELCFRHSRRILFMLNKITKTEKMPRMHCRSQYLKRLLILEISIDLCYMVHTDRYQFGAHDSPQEARSVGDLH
jgi:hypothetical protein